MERSSFEIFKSNISHLVKDKGELTFIRDMLCSDEVNKLFERKWYAECLYLLAMIDYLSRKNDIPLYTGYDKLRTGKLDKIPYPPCPLSPGKGENTGTGVPATRLGATPKARMQSRKQKTTEKSCTPL